MRKSVSISVFISVAIVCATLTWGRLAMADVWRGQVIDAETGEGVSGAYIEITAGEKTVQGLTDGGGRFGLQGGQGPADVRV